MRSLSLALLLAAPALSQEAANPLPRGERLVGEFNCTACHAAPAAVTERLAPQLAPRLDQVASRVTPDYLLRYLKDPAGTNPMGRMPDQLASLSAEEKETVALALTHYLMGLGEPMDRSPSPAHLSAVERGRRTFHEAGCVACHRPQEELWELDWTLAELFAEVEEEEEEVVEDEEPVELFIPEGTLAHPDVPIELEWLAGKTTVDGLARFLEDPLAVRPSGRMPDLGLTSEEASDIARYLLRGQTSLGDWTYDEAPGLQVAYYEAPFNALPRPIDWDALEPKWTDSASEISIARKERGDNVGFRWLGMINVPEDGTYTFWTNSDDGSHLWVDGEHVVNNGGVHGMRTVQGQIDLDQGRHAIEINFFEQGGGEGMEVSWAGPGFERQPIPASALSHAALVYRPDATEFVRDEALAARGAEWYRELGCASCHTTGDAAVDGQGTVAAASLFELAADAQGACLSGDTPRIHFDSPADGEAVRETLRGARALEQALDASTQVTHTLDRLNCYACHQRDDLGGTHPKVKGYFLADETAELGDEGRIPPHLTKVGAKLRKHYLEEVLLRDGRARPYMHTRMPGFGSDNVGHLVDGFAAADPAPVETKDWDVSPDILAAGHELVGTAGLGCIQCHTFGGQRSLGVQAVDLTTMVDRIQYDWFKKLMLDPKSMNMDTRMPSFWPEGESPSPLFGANPEAQIEAVWAFLSLGEGMAVPEGLSTSGDAYELVPTDGPVSAGVFMKDVSPRTLVVGFPERAHYAFDMQASRVAKLWRGRFFNTKGTWQGRAGQLESPPSEDVLLLPEGPAVARLADPGDPWPRDAARPLGRHMDADRVPILRYAVGDVTVEERLEPELRFGGSVMLRTVTVTADRPVRDLYFRAYAWPSGGDSWARPEPTSAGALRYGSMQPALELAVDGAPAPTPVVGKDVDLLIPIQLEKQGAQYTASFTVEVSW